MALQLAAALDQYERDADRMVATWLDMDLYREVSDEVEQLRACAAALPEVAVHWVELLIAHAELVHSLWRLRFREDPEHAGRLAQVRRRHAECIEALRVRCLRLAGSGGAQAARA